MYVIFKVQFHFALEVWFSIFSCYITLMEDLTLSFMDIQL